MRRRSLFRNKGGAIPQDNFVSEWKLEETSGTTVLDSKGANNGTVNNASLLTTTGKVGNGFLFTSTYYPVLVPYSSDFIFRDATGNLPFSLCFWNKIIVGSSLRIFARWYLGGGNTMEFALSANYLGLKVWNQDGSIVDYKLQETGDYPNVADDTWKHLGVVFDPTASPKVKIFVNGDSKPITTTGTLTDIRVQNHTLRFGGLEREGIMDEIKFYKKALSDAEILSIYNEEL